ncbi:hypothetical protein CHCC14821_3416 [Bacillus paralicheniformis]|nr:hypothetical protein CHCC14821_3416 [Bacillus paralicheniformis]
MSIIGVTFFFDQFDQFIDFLFKTREQLNCQYSRKADIADLFRCFLNECTVHSYHLLC